MALTTRERKAKVIDDYFRNKNYYPHIPFKAFGNLLMEECLRMGEDGLWPSTAAALIEKESGGKNIFGCDFGSDFTNKPPFCNIEVNKERVKALIKNYYTPPVGGANGIGLTQLTSIEYVEEAEDLGGAHLFMPQMRVGFRVLNDNINDLGFQAGAAAYNAGRGNWQSVYNTYGADVVRLQKQWYARLNPETPAPKPPSNGKAPYKAPWPPHVGATLSWSDRTRRVVQEIEQKFGVTCSTYRGHGTTGEAWGIDVWVAPPKAKANQVQEDYGDMIQEWVEENMGRLNINYIIWWNWMRYFNGGWFNYEPYAWEYAQKSGNPNMNDNRHLNHVHLQINAA